MKNFIKNATLFIFSVIISYFSAIYFGALYDHFAPQYDSLFGAPKQITNIVVGLPFAYVFFTLLLFEALGFKNKNQWLVVLLLPVTLFWLAADLTHIYLPVILGLLGWVLGVGIHRLIENAKKKTA
jgi:hypothetical protein